MGQAAIGAIALAGLTQAQAADKIGVALNTFSRRVNGHLPFSWPEIVRLAEATDMTVSELVANAERIFNRTDAA